jgi:hypothetical protein
MVLVAAYRYLYEILEQHLAKYQSLEAMEQELEAIFYLSNAHVLQGRPRIACVTPGKKEKTKYLPHEIKCHHLLAF